MIEIIVGALLLAAGVAGAGGAAGLLGKAGRLWPRPYTRSDAQLFASSGFLLRFMALLSIVAGAAMIILGIVR